MRNKLSNMLWGLFFVVVGLGFAGNAFDVWSFELFFDGWWTFFIIIPCLISIVQKGAGTGSIIWLVIGIMLLLTAQSVIDSSVLRKLFVPIILVIIGLNLIFHNMFRKKFVRNDSTTNTEGTTSNNGAEHGGFSHSGSNHSGSEYSAIFSSNNVHLKDEHFMGTNLTAVFGAVVLDLREAVIDTDVEITATAIFGGIDIYLPRGIQVKVSNVPIFGGVDNKAGKYSTPGAPTIYLNSTCMFGGIDIK